MIKLVLYSTLCVVLIFYHFETLGNPRLEVLGEGVISIYSREVVTSPLITSVTNIGFGFIYTTCATNANELRAKFNVIDGESIALTHSACPHEILRQLGHTMVSYQRGGGLFTIYAYSSRGRDFIRQDGNRINMQIAVRDGRVTVGWPVILGSY